MTLIGSALLKEVKKASVLSAEGSKVSEVELPKVFNAELRPQLVKRVFHALLTHRLQPKGAWKGSAHKYSVESLGAGYGLARIARLKVRGTNKANAGGFVPTAVGGRPTHPPVPEKKIHKYITNKEKRAALASAIAFTASREWVVKRGHRLPEGLELPVVVEDEVQKIKRTKELKGFLERLGLGEELKRCSVKKVRAGKGKRRGRRYKRRAGPLIVVAKDEGIVKAAENIPGVEVVKAKDLSVLHLAPGASPGRLTIYTVGALSQLKRLEGG